MTDAPENEQRIPPDPLRLAGDTLHNAFLKSLSEGNDVTPDVRAALDLLAISTRQNKYRHAGAIVGGARLGRSAIDDAEALRRMASFPAHRQHQAAGAVAQQMAGAAADGQQIKADAKRLRRKWKAQIKNAQNTSEHPLESGKRSA